MAIAEISTTPTGVEGGIEKTEAVDIDAELQAHFGDMVVMDWDAFEGVVYRKNDQRTPIGGFMQIEVRGVDGTGEVTRRVNVDDQSRPLSEPVIAAMGQRAIFNAEGPKDAAIMVKGSNRKYAKTIIRILCTEH